VSDSNPGGPPQNPYGQAPEGQNPYGGQPPPPNPYGQPPPPPNPYGQPPRAENPYGQPPFPQPAPPQQPYGQQTYGGGPLNDGLDMYGRPLVAVKQTRPGTVTAAGWIALVVSGLSALLYGILTFAMIVAKDDVLREIDKAVAEQGGAGDFDAETAFGAVVGVLVVVIVWCLIACLLAVFVLRRSNAARIMLVISAVVAGLLSLLGVKSGVLAIPLLACLATVILLFTGGAGDWFARRPRY
jgi:hypothetical protein